MLIKSLRHDEGAVRVSARPNVARIGASVRSSLGALSAGYLRSRLAIPREPNIKKKQFWPLPGIIGKGLSKITWGLGTVLGGHVPKQKKCV